MRHIPLHGQEPDARWVAKANALLGSLDAAPDAAARHAIIDANSGVWGELKDWLLELSHGKCWFSEAKDCFSHWDVEHYRPKKSAKDANGTKHDGYWWLAFDWHNLRICGNAGNRKKGTFFPLREGCSRCAPYGDLRHEDPQFLDPADEDDPILLSFNVQGDAIPAPHISEEWERKRVEYSVARCMLNFGPLIDARRVVWAECWRRAKDYLDEYGRCNADRSNGIARAQLKQAAKDIRAMIRGDREFSAVARACILSSGQKRLVALLQTT